MEIVLLERVEKLGQMGDVVKVKAGYARNCLLPQKKALRATKANLAVFESQRKEIEARNLEAKKEAEAVAKTLDGKHITLLRQAGESGQLYGSATTRDIAIGISEDLGVKVKRAQVELEKPIKDIGVYTVGVRLHPEVTAKVSVSIARSSEEAASQLDAHMAVDSVADVFESDELAKSAAQEIVEDIAEDVAAEDVAVEGGSGEDAKAE